MKLSKSFLFASLAGLLILAGCANIKEMTRGALGISTNEIDLARPKAIKRVFACDYNTAYNNTLKALEKLNSYVYAKKSDLIAIYISQEDTTVVGIFFKEIDPANTQLEISSPSTYGRDLMAKKLFPEVEFLISVKKEPVKEEVKGEVKEEATK